MKAIIEKKSKQRHAQCMSLCSCLSKKQTVKENNPTQIKTNQSEKTPCLSLPAFLILNPLWQAENK
jgi:hypothetical protein